MFNFFNEDVSLPEIDIDQISCWLVSVIETEKKTAGDISIIFCSDSFLINLNKMYLNHDYYTDIITFDYSESNIISGDVFISTDRVKENAIKFSNTFNSELYRIMVHGILHLIGYKDFSISEKETMTGKEDEFLNGLIKK